MTGSVLTANGRLNASFRSFDPRWAAQHIHIRFKRAFDIVHPDARPNFGIVRRRERLLQVCAYFVNQPIVKPRKKLRMLQIRVHSRKR